MNQKPAPSMADLCFFSQARPPVSPAHRGGKRAIHLLLEACGTALAYPPGTRERHPCLKGSAVGNDTVGHDASSTHCVGEDIVQSIQKLLTSKAKQPGTLKQLRALAFVLMLLACSPCAFAADEVDSGDTAWMLTATALVLFMTIPGLSLFYGGLVRTKNVLSVLMQCFAITSLVTILWVVYGYSLAFDTTGMEAGVLNLRSLVGGLHHVFLTNSPEVLPGGTIPTTVFICFQLTFAIITPALVAGAFAERMKFSAVLLFTALWFTFVYAPVCHMVWAGDGSLMGDLWGVFDFAGGTVVHINAGIAALLAAVLIGKRQG